MCSTQLFCSRGTIWYIFAFAQCKCTSLDSVFFFFSPSPIFYLQWLFPNACRYKCCKRWSPRSRSLLHCCSSPPSSELGRGTCTYRLRGTCTCTRWLRRAGCCRDGTKTGLKEELPKSVTLRANGGGILPFHKVNHVDDARRADHRLIRKDGSHGLLHTELRRQGRQKRLDLLPGSNKKFDH